MFCAIAGPRRRRIKRSVLRWGWRVRSPNTEDKLIGIMEDLESAGCVVFPAVRCAYFKHVMKEYARFLKTSEVVSICDPSAGMLLQVGAPDETMKTLLIDTIGVGVRDLFASLPESVEDDSERQQSLEFMCVVAKGIASQVKWDDMKQDLLTQYKAFCMDDVEGLSAPERAEAQTEVGQAP